MKSRQIGIVLIVIGAALIFWGYSVYDSAGSQVSRALSGDTPIEAWVGLVSGAVCVILGILRVK